MQGAHNVLLNGYPRTAIEEGIVDDRHWKTGLGSGRPWAFGRRWSACRGMGDRDWVDGWVVAEAQHVCAFGSADSLEFKG